MGSVLLQARWRGVLARQWTAILKKRKDLAVFEHALHIPEGGGITEGNHTIGRITVAVGWSRWACHWTAMEAQEYKEQG